VQIAQATPETYRYVAGYVTKKMYEIDGKKANNYYDLGQPKPFAKMSLRPGIGDAWYQKHKEEIWEAGYIQCTNGKQARIPRYYEKQMETENPSYVYRFDSMILACRSFLISHSLIGKRKSDQKENAPHWEAISIFFLWCHLAQYLSSKALGSILSLLGVTFRRHP